MTPTDNQPLDRIVERFRQNRGRISKQALRNVTDAFGPTDWVTGPGDDAALIARAGDGLVAAGEALFPPFVAADPFGAGVGAVIANVNDVAAMGGRPLAIIDTVVATEEVARQVLAGLRYAAELYGVPVVGGHLTTTDGPPSVSAFIVGEVSTPLLARNAAPGHALLMAACLDGRLRSDFAFHPSYRQRGARVRGDVAVLPTIADSGAVVAAKDISMAGTLGTIAMLLQPNGHGAVIDLDRLPVPDGIDLVTWLDVFPSFGFILCANPDRVDEVLAAFTARDLACALVGSVDSTGRLRIRFGSSDATLLDDTRTAATGLRDRPYRTDPGSRPWT